MILTVIHFTSIGIAIIFAIARTPLKSRLAPTCPLSYERLVEELENDFRRC